MLSLLHLLSLATLTTAHFRVLEPQWRGESFGEGVSQWIYPCANVSELPADSSNRTQWPTTGGSIKINASHPWALTYVNIGIGTNVTSFNISLVEGFNQTGTGLFCLKEAGRTQLEEGVKAANMSMDDLDGQQASVQIIQISHSGASLFNCADITFNSSAALLSDDECKNGTGVSGVAIQNADTPTPTGSAAPTSTTGAASVVRPVVGSGLLTALIAWGLL